MKLLLSLILSVIAFNVIAQTFTPFTWQNPKYGAHAINSTKHINAQNFIAVGDAGAIELSNDNGSTWQRIQPFTFVDLKGIFVKDSLEIFICGSLDNGRGEIYKSIDAGLTWTMVFNNMSLPLKDIHFPNDSVGYCVGKYSAVAKTTDGGNTWTNNTNINSINGTLNAVWFLNSDTGFIGRSTSPYLYKTTNGGLTYNQVFGFSGTACYSLKFLNDTLGYAGAYNSRIFKTTNGGATWSQQTTFQTNEKVTSIDFADLNHGIAVTNSYVYRTSNGTNWSNTAPTGLAYGPNYISAAYSSTGNIIVGDSFGGLWSSLNFTNTYTNPNTNSGLFNYRRIKFVDAQNGWVGGEGYGILKTNNGGNTWTVANPTTYIDYVTDIAAISSSKLVIASGSSIGIVAMTTNGGSTFTQQTLSATNGLNAISYPNATTGYVVGNNGVAFKTTNGGTSYTSINTGITNNITEVFFVTQLYGFVMSQYGEIKKTIDGGLTWTTLNGSGLGTTQQIYFTDIANGYIVNNSGGVFRTTDGGQTFNAAGTVCVETPLDMHFINDSTGFISGSSYNTLCNVGYTSNYGNTWTTVHLPYAYASCGVFAFDTANYYVVGQQQSVMHVGTTGVITGNKTKVTLKGNSEIQVYPNPTNDILNVSNIKSNTPIQILDARGNEINCTIEQAKTQSDELQTTQIPTSNLPVGMYFIKVGNEVMKFMKVGN